MIRSTTTRTGARRIVCAALLACTASVRSDETTRKGTTLQPAKTPDVLHVVTPLSLKLPDLQITPKPAGVGPVYDFLIKNVGKAPSKESLIQFYALPPCKKPSPIGSGKLLETGKVKPLIVTTSPSYAFSYSIAMPENVRGCRLKAVLNADHAFAEASVDNNEAIVETALPPAPDLVLHFQAGDGLWTHKLVVKNEGNAPAGASVTHMTCTCEPDYLYGKQYMPCDPSSNVCMKEWDWNVPALAPGESHVVNFPLASHNHTKTWWHAYADSKYQVAESNEGNNSLSNN